MLLRCFSYFVYFLDVLLRLLCQLFDSCHLSENQIELMGLHEKGGGELLVSLGSCNLLRKLSDGSELSLGRLVELVKCLLFRLSNFQFLQVLLVNFL